MTGSPDGFSDRTKNFEARFAHDERRRFQALARACRRAGDWAGERAALAEPDMAALSEEAAGYAMREDGWNALARMLTERLGGALSERQVRHAMDDIYARAAQEIAQEAGL